MFNKYFQQELSSLREIAGEFSKENPAIAPMLGDSATDPDVERLLEGVAFLTGSIRQRIDDEFPEIIHEFLRQIWPHYLRPLPSSSILGFTHGEKEKSGHVPTGAFVDTLPVDGTRCRYKTCYDVDVEPLSITGVDYQEPAGKNPVIRLGLQLLETTAENWKIEKLKFYLGGNFKKAADLYYILFNNLNRIIIRNTGDGSECVLDKSCLKPAGFSDDEVLIPYPSNSFKGYRLIQEYFHMPEKFLFVELSGWENWINRVGVTEFEIEFQLEKTPDHFFKIDANSFVLASTPVVNTFPHPAAPVIVDHKKNDYKIRPAGDDMTKYQIYSVEKVSGFIRGIGKEQNFEAFHSFRTGDETHIYNEKIRKSPVHDAVDYSITLSYPPGFSSIDLKTLSFDIICTNGNLPELIDSGGICVPTASVPGFVKFKNLIKPTSAVLPPLGSPMLWRLVSLLTLNASSLSKPENLKSLLRLYLMKEGNRDKKRVIANEKRIEGIKFLETASIDRLVKGIMMRGLEVRLKVSMGHFAGPGDLYLFGMILDNFLGLYVTMNTFTRLVINEIDTGERFTWPERIGQTQLI